MEDNEQADDGNAAADESIVRADQPKTCANCGKQIDTSEWHPLVTRTDDDGTFRVYAFCSEKCRDEWTDSDTESVG